MRLSQVILLLVFGGLAGLVCYPSAKQPKRDYIIGSWLRQTNSVEGGNTGEQKRPHLVITEERWVYIHVGRGCTYSWVNQDRVFVRCNSFDPGFECEFPDSDSGMLVTRCEFADGGQIVNVYSRHN